jgi:Domain of unknown function (DUF4926)
MKARPDLHDAVELREALGGQPVGAVGAVVELLPAEVLVEFADQHGRTVELLSVPYEALSVRSAQPAERRAPG